MMLYSDGKSLMMLNFGVKQDPSYNLLQYKLSGLRINIILIPEIEMVLKMHAEPSASYWSSSYTSMRS